MASSAAVVNGIVYTASENGYVYAFDAYTGVCYWKYSLPGMGTLSSPSVVDGVVYIGSDYGLFALNAYTGEKIWQSAKEVLIMSTPAVSGGFVFTGSFVSQGTDEHAAYAFRASDGQLVWKFITSDYVDSSPAVVGSTVYINCDDGNLYALNAINGALIWKFNTSLAYPFGQNSGSPTVVNGAVYTVNFYGNVIAINAANGQKIWNHSAQRLSNGFTSPVIYNGIVYISTQNALYALDSSTGDEIWQCAVSSSSFPSVVNGVIYLTSSDGKIWAIDASTDTKTLHYSSLDSGVRVQAAIARGVIYVGTVQGTFYAIGTPDLITPQPTPGPTPTNYPQPTPTPTPTTNPTTQPTQTPTNNPTSQPKVNITPHPTQTPNPTNRIRATTNQGTQITLSIAGNITSAQISNVTITTNQATSTVAFNVTGQSGNMGFVNLTIPKNAFSTDGAPTIYRWHTCPKPRLLVRRHQLLRLGRNTLQHTPNRNSVRGNCTHSYASRKDPFPKYRYSGNSNLATDIHTRRQRGYSD